MVGFDVFNMYLSLKCHFTQDKYDYFKFNKKTTVKYTTYRNKRSDWKLFESLSKDNQIEDKLICLLSNNPENYVDLIWHDDPTFIFAFKNQQRNIKNLNYHISEELKKIAEVCPKFNDLFLINEKIPIILSMFLKNEISRETISVLLNITNAYKQWNKILSDDFIWKNNRLQIIKYHDFIKKKYQKNKIVSDIQKHFV